MCLCAYVRWCRSASTNERPKLPVAHYLLLRRPVATNLSSHPQKNKAKAAAAAAAAAVAAMQSSKRQRRQEEQDEEEEEDDDDEGGCCGGDDVEEVGTASPPSPLPPPPPPPPSAAESEPRNAGYRDEARIDGISTYQGNAVSTLTALLNDVHIAVHVYITDILYLSTYIHNMPICLS